MTILYLTLVILLTGWFSHLLAQQMPAQDVINATVSGDISHILWRIDRLESMVNYALGAIVAQVIALLFQISNQVRKRNS